LQKITEEETLSFAIFQKADENVSLSIRQGVLETILSLLLNSPSLHKVKIPPQMIVTILEIPKLMNMMVMVMVMVMMITMMKLC
jgi:hypothetical protein